MKEALFPDLVINGETVPHVDVAAETQNHSAPKGKPGLAWRKAARAIAVRTLLLQEARRRGLTPDAREVAPGRYESDEDALVRALLDEVVVVDVPTEKEVRAEWRRDPSRFRTPPLWEASHILVACNPKDKVSVEVAEEKASAFARQLAENPRMFGRLARAESDCGSKSAGGSLGQLGPGETVPEFEAVLRSLKEGETTSAPVQTRFGWHIIRLDAVAERQELPFEAARDRVSDALEKTAWARSARAFINSLVAGAEISGVDISSG